MLCIGVMLISVLSIQGLSAAHAAGLRLAVSVAPQQYLLKELKTPDSRIVVVIPPGHSPATWDPTPRQMQDIVSADVLFPIGVPFEQVWLPKLRQHAPDMLIADTLKGIELMHFPQTGADNTEHHGHAHSHSGIDPHVWLDPVRAMAIAANMAATLQQLDPEHSTFYAKRLDVLSRNLLELHHEISQTLAPLQQRSFMVYHPSWGYFAARYNLNQIALEKDGKEPSGIHLAQLIQRAKTEHITTIFVQHQFSTRAARAIAAQTGATIETLDPLDPDLAHTLRLTAQKLADSLKP